MSPWKVSLHKGTHHCPDHIATPNFLQNEIPQSPLWIYCVIILLGNNRSWTNSMMNETYTHTYTLSSNYWEFSLAEKDDQCLEGRWDDCKSPELGLISNLASLVKWGHWGQHHCDQSCHGCLCPENRVQAESPHNPGSLEAHNQ